MCQCTVRRQRNYRFLTQTSVHVKNICMDVTLCVSFLQISLPDCICISVSLCLHSCSRTSCIFPPCFLCIQSCVFLIRPAMFSPRFVWQQLC